MIPFPGESLAIQDAYDVTAADSSLWSDVVWRAGDRTITAGDEWRAWTYSGFGLTYLEETGLGCDVSWVVEVTSGTVSLAAAETLDPTYVDTSGPVGTPLGSHTVTGPATLVIPSTFTSDDVLDDDGSVSAAFLLQLVATSGSAVVQQVKMRIWPVGGPLGGWSASLPAWDEPYTAEILAGAVGTGAVGVDATSVGAWDELNDVTLPAAVTAATAPTDIDLGRGAFATPGGSGSMSMSFDGVDQGAHATGSIVVLLWAGLTDDAVSTFWPLGTEAEAYPYIRVPTEVSGENDTIAYSQISGSPSFAWVSPSIDVSIYAESGNSTPVPGPSGVAIDGYAGEFPTTFVSTNFRRLHDFTPSFSAAADLSCSTALDDPVTATVALPSGGRDLLVEMSWTGLVDLPDFSSWVGTVFNTPVVQVNFGTTTTEQASTIHHPTYRVWDPFAVPSTVVRHGVRNDGRYSTAPRRWGQQSSFQSGRVGGHQ